MESVLSSKYQLVIPKQVRKQLDLKSNQKIEFLVKDRMITLIPERPLKEMRGYLKKMNTKGFRSHKERV
ncbi:MAG: AbrB family transcriptional regulator [Omnitrophica WOR_2 bacterium RIFOXYA2_FULL_45_12]|nr:MAG: AbrB family transcriptional regulator [Omnitrophica WOR_2 bacterium RIFOXYA2_FULL_45_12]HBU07805.1 AbrB family transcriptional regulator [Candidatus Omnitrophota bacterium]